MSGWLLTGLPGAIYLSGLSEAWIAVGLVMGAYLNWRFVAALLRMRLYTERAGNALTLCRAVHLGGQPHGPGVQRHAQEPPGRGDGVAHRAGLRSLCTTAAQRWPWDQYGLQGALFATHRLAPRAKAPHQLPLHPRW